ncbi:MAG: FtsQ-type POTRA domain-containing protein [Alphaproteobacteria bacterium]|nr:FtsQ-type POTRA domain-containing protein [Alphaproteobacteria bacterium]
MRFLMRTRSTPRKATRRVVRRRPKPSWLRPALRITAIGAFAVACGSGIGWAWQSGTVQRVWSSTVAGVHTIAAEQGLAVNDVLVTGRGETAADDLLAALDVRRGMPILALDLTALRDRVAALPWIKTVRVERRLPDTLYVAIEERRPIGLWQRNGKLSLVDAEGTVIPESNIRRFGALPVLIGDDAPARAAAALAMLSGEPDLRTRVRALTWVGGRRWTIRLDAGGGVSIDVQLPEGDAASAWAHLAALERDHGVLGREVMTIDLRIPDQLIVRVPGGAEERAIAPGKNT